MSIKGILNTLLLPIVVFTVCIGLCPAPQKAGAPLTEADMIRLLTMGASNKAITDLVHRYGVSFRLDDRTVQRLAESGAQESLLEAIRVAAPPPPQPPKKPAATAPPPTPDPATLEASRHLKLGEVKAQGRDFEGALREFAEAERIRPKWGEVFFQRSLLFAVLERYSEAAAEGKKYIAVVGSGTEGGAIPRMIAEWQSQAERKDKAGRLAEQGQQELKSLNLEPAVKSFREAVKLHYSLSNLLYLAGAELLEGDYESLSKTVEEALTVDPRSGYALLYKGAGELGQGDTAAAMSNVQGALALNPNLAFGYALLSAMIGEQGDSKMKPGAPDRTVPINPSSASAHNRLGWVLWNNGDYDGALDELGKATQIETTHPAWHSDLSYALHFRRDPTGALAAAREALRLDSKLAAAHDAMGLALESRGSLDQANQEYEEALRLSSPSLPEFARHRDQVKQKRAQAHAEQHSTVQFR